MMSEAAILALFSLCNAVRVVAYIPQLLCIARDPHGATSISYTSWILFALSHAATALYALSLSSDWWLAANFAANALCCVAVVALTARKRRQSKPPLAGGLAGKTLGGMPLPQR